MGNQQTIKPSGLTTIPSNYPTVPTPGKLEILWDANSTSLYRRLSPYTVENQSLIGGFANEPFYYTFIDEAGKGLSGLKKYESRIFPIGSAPIDVIRVSKFLGSGNGIVFLGKQLLLQTGNVYNETRIYNPTSPIVAAGMGLALGTVRPMRSFDTSAGLAGILRSLIGSTIPDAILGAPKINPPAGTVSTALPDSTLTSGGKGLLRASTANRGLGNLQNAWPQTTKGSSFSSGFTTAVKAFATSLFANFIPQTQSGIQARSDEGAYGLMVGAGGTKFVYVGRNGSILGFGQQWIAGSKTMRKNGQYTSQAYRMFVDENGNPVEIANTSLSTGNIPNVGSIGYSIAESTDPNRPGFRYGDSLGTQKNGDFEASDMMIQFSNYASPSKQFPTKKTDQNYVSKANIELLKMLNNLRSVSNGLYKVDVPNNSRVISSGLSDKSGYDRLFSATQGQDRDRGLSPKNYPDGVLKDYRTVRTVDNSIGSNIPSLRFPGAGNMDALNTLTVLPKTALANLTDSTPSSAWTKLNLNGWKTRKWSPYNDDQIAFYFYDVVNENYIPFRATIKGLAETSAAQWEELSFIGRGDRIYSYSGFNRTLALGFSIVISSIAELAPTWQRINYLSTLTKPANYTTSTINQVVNRFMVPPMVMITLGDMYKEQPILIQSLTVGVPDDASWETTNEFNSSQWEYLASYISSPGILYGQLPRQVEITLGAILLEKERAIVGGANFGSAPRTEDWSAWNTNTIPTGTEPNKLNKSLVVDVTGKTIFNTNPTS